jgi:hypothetical protein
VEDEPEIAIEADTDAFADTAELDNLLAVSVGECWVGGAEKKGTDDADGFESLAEDTFFERFDVNGDVGKLRHASSRRNRDVK